MGLVLLSRPDGKLHVWWLDAGHSNAVLIQTPAGADILVDDRAETAGIKFNDADLIGIPLRVVLGPKNLKQGKVELKVRKTGEMILPEISELIPQILKILDKLE